MRRQCIQDGTPLPKFLKEEPTLYMGLELYWNAFWELDGDRSIGMGFGRIPWTAIAEYAMAHEYDPDQTDRLFRFVRVLDEAYLKYHRQQADAAIKKK